MGPLALGSHQGLDHSWAQERMWTIRLMTPWSAGWNPDCQISHKARKLGRWEQNDAFSTISRRWVFSSQPRSSLVAPWAPFLLGPHLYFGLTASKLSWEEQREGIQHSKQYWVWKYRNTLFWANSARRKKREAAKLLGKATKPI